MGLPLLEANKPIASKLPESPSADGGRFLMDASAAPGTCNQPQNHNVSLRIDLCKMSTMSEWESNYTFPFSVTLQLHLV